MMLVLQDWVAERIANCERIAAARTGADREGWLEDAAYFRAILNRIGEVPQAAFVDAGACDFCPGVHINFRDDDREAIATAVVPIEHLEPFIAQIRAAAGLLAHRASAPARRQ